jgi:DNA-directed RNA polymerase beta subunit
MSANTNKDMKKSNAALNKRFHALDHDGMARVGECLNAGDVYVNKYVPVINES